MLASWRQEAEGRDKAQDTPKPSPRDLLAANPYFPHIAVKCQGITLPDSIASQLLSLLVEARLSAHEPLVRLSYQNHIPEHMGLKHCYKKQALSSQHEVAALLCRMLLT